MALHGLSLLQVLLLHAPTLHQVLPFLVADCDDQEGAAERAQRGEREVGADFGQDRKISEEECQGKHL